MKESRLDNWQEFVTYQKSREAMKLSSKLSSMMDYCEYILHVQFDKNMKGKQKNKRSRQELTEEYREAFKSLSQDQKLSYYMLFMKCITLLINGKADCGPTELKGIFSSDVYSRSFNLKIWKMKKMRLDRVKGILYAEKDNKIKTYILSDYLLRRSKNKEFYCFVLQAINKSPHEKSRTVHLGFKQEAKFTQWLKQLQQVFKVLTWKFIENQIKNSPLGNALESSNLMRSSDIMSDRSITHKMQKQEMTEMSKSYVFESSSSIGDEEFRKIKEELRNKQQSSPQFSPKLQEQFFSGNSSDEEQQNKNKNETQRKSITQEIGNMDIDELEALNSKDEQKVGKQDEAKENIFHRLIPKFNLQTLSSSLNYANLFEENKLKIVASLDNPAKLKMFIQLEQQSHKKAVLNVLTQPQTFKRLNSEVQQLSLKTLIKSQNSALMYLKIKAYNKLYRPRDFVFLRHVFNCNGNTYIIDKSIQNLQYPPFTTIVRGQFCTVWGIVRENNQNMLVAEILMKNEGYLNDSQNVNLILKYLKGFSQIEKVLHQSKAVLNNFNLFNDVWEIVEEKKEAQKIKLMDKSYENQKQVINESSPQKESNLFKKVKVDSSSSPSKTAQSSQKQVKNQNKQSDEKKTCQQKVSVFEVNKEQKGLQLRNKYSHMEEEKGQIQANQVQEIQKLNSMIIDGVKRDFDVQGNVIISHKFIHTKYLCNPLVKSKPNFQDPIKGHPIWKGEWKRDEKTGPIIFIDQKKIEDQKGVLKFILSKIGKNIMSGKSVLNISLPVDIFCAQSNLQRFLYSFTYAPTIIEPVVSNKSSIQRLKRVIVFGLSNSILYLNMQKPFNPILGETFQCWIDGCPSYAQQISHHPPVAALLFEGRGFRVTAQLESKVELHMNSGCGTNEGVYKVKFDDGLQICFSSPGGEVSGLVYGDRKFNIVGKAYYWIQSENIFIQIVFNPTRKGFFSVGKQQQPIDYFQGQICKVKPEFMEAFLKKRKSPIDKDILERIGKIHGIWDKQILYEEETLLNLEKQYPVKLEYEANPLPSDANWRQDIAYRRIRDISKAQSEKERLEVLQRKDRKLRESNPNHSHHKK